MAMSLKEGRIKNEKGSIVQIESEASSGAESRSQGVGRESGCHLLGGDGGDGEG